MCPSGTISGMQRPHASRDVRERALAALDAGRSMADVAACVRTDPSTVRRWRRQRALHGEIGPRPRAGRPRLVCADDQADLLAQVAAAADATVAEHCARWEAAQGVRLSPSTMSRTLRRLGLTRKKDADRASRTRRRGRRGPRP